MGRIGADEVEDDVRAPPVRRLADRVDVPAVEDLVRAELAREAPTALVRIECENVARTELPDELQGDVPDTTDADDGDGRPRKRGAERAASRRGTP